MAINKVSETTKKRIRDKSVLALPDKPSEKGYSAQQLKEYFTNLVLGDESALTEIDRISEEINNYLNGIENTTIKNYIIDSILSKFTEQSPVTSIKFEGNKLKYNRFGDPVITEEIDITQDNSVFFNEQTLKNKDGETILPVTTIDNLVDTIYDKTVREFLMLLHTRINELGFAHNNAVETINKNLEAIVGGDAPDALNSIKELAEALNNNPQSLNDILQRIADININKVDKINGKGLSTNDFDNTSKAFLDSLKSKDLAFKTDIKTSLSELTQDSNHRTVTDAEKQSWDSKANATHGHKIDDVSGLKDALNSKSDSTHTHTLEFLGAEASGTASGLVSKHNTDENAHQHIQEMISSVGKRIDGINSALSFENFNQLTDWFKGTYTRPDGKLPSDLYVGQYIYLKNNDEDDYWVSEIPATISNLSILNTDKVDLDEYVQKDELKRVAYTGDYTDLTNKPTIPTNLSQLNEDDYHKTITKEKLELIDTNKEEVAKKLNANLGSSAANKMIITDSTGNITTAEAGSMSILVDNLESTSTTMAPTANQVRVLNNKKLDKQQGADNANKYLQVNASGMIDLVDLEVPESMPVLGPGTIQLTGLEDGFYKVLPSSSFQWKGTSGICSIASGGLLLVTTRTDGTRDSIVFTQNTVQVANSADSGFSMKTLITTNDLIVGFYTDMDLIFNNGSMREDWQNRMFHTAGRRLYYNSNQAYIQTSKYDIVYIGSLNDSGELNFVLYQQDGLTIGYGANRSDVPTPKKILYSDLATKTYVDEMFAGLGELDASGAIAGHNADKTAHPDIRALIPDTSSFLPLTAGTDKKLTGVLATAGGPGKIWDTSSGVKFGDGSYISGDSTSLGLQSTDGVYFRVAGATRSVINSTLLRPSTTETMGLGSSDYKWKEIHGKTIYQGGKQVANKEDIPDVSGFIKKDVNDLTNYKNEVQLTQLLETKQDEITSSNKLSKDLVSGLGTASTANTGTSSGNVPVLGTDGKLPSSVIPASAITNTFVANNEAGMLALSTADIGDVCVRTDVKKSFILKATPYSTLANWQELLTPTDAVTSVNGQTGAVSLSASDVGALPSTTEIPKINNGTLYFEKNGGIIGSFTNNQDFDSYFDISMPRDVLYYGEMELDEDQKRQARTNIGAGTSNFSGNFQDLQRVPSLVNSINGETGYITGIATEEYVNNAVANAGVGGGSGGGSSGGGSSGGGITNITEAYTRITDLDTGIYNFSNSSIAQYIYYNGQTGTDSQSVHLAGGSTILEVSKTDENWGWHFINGAGILYSGTTTLESGSNAPFTYINTLANVPSSRGFSGYALISGGSSVSPTWKNLALSYKSVSVSVSVPANSSTSVSIKPSLAMGKVMRMATSSMYVQASTTSNSTSTSSTTSITIYLHNCSASAVTVNSIYLFYMNI